MKHILSKTIAVTAIIFACSATTSKVNAMMPNPSILAETAAYLTEIAPEIAAGAVAIVAATNDRFRNESQTGYPVPETELVGQDSNGQDAGPISTIIDGTAETIDRRTRAANRDRSDGCDIF